MTATPILRLDAARGEGEGEHLPKGAFDLVLADGDFALIEIAWVRRGTAFADLCMGLLPLALGRAAFLGHDWSTTTQEHGDAMRGHIGRLFHLPLRADTPDVAARVLLGRMHHTRIPEIDLRAEAAELALRFGLPGLPSGPARLLGPRDLLRAACVRAFLGAPRMIVIELPLASQEADLLPQLLEVGADARGRGACVMWLAASGPALRDSSINPTHRLRMTDAGLIPARRPAMAPDRVPA